MTDSRGPQKFWGKYRGTVVNNIDPENRGRLQLTVPDVTGLIPSTWAECCAPLSGMTGAAAGVFMVPPIGAAVWVEFERGDPNKPIWTGGRWESMADVPLMAIAPPPLPQGQNIVIQSTLQHSLTISDAMPIPIPAPIPAPAPAGTGGIILRSPSGAMIVVNDTGIYIHNGKGASIEMIGLSVMINKVALVVT